MAPPFPQRTRNVNLQLQVCYVLEKADWPYEVLVVSKNIWGHYPKISTEDPPSGTPMKSLTSKQLNA